MISLLSVTRFLNKELNNKAIPDFSRNGMQVRSKKTASKIGTAVDASLSTFSLAKQKNCDLVIVHHGLFWKGQPDISGIRAKRISFLKQNRISLYASHLPLDMHPHQGNNIRLAGMLNLEKVREFGDYHGLSIGYQGNLASAVTIDKLRATINKKLKTRSIILPFGRNKIKRIGIVSGGGSSSIYEAHKKKIDCLLIGEAPHHIYHEAKDLKMNIILGGHYQTETLGVQALGELLQKQFGLPHVFLDVPTVI